MSNFSPISEEFDRFIKSCSDKKTAWKFFLRKNLRSQAVYGHADYNLFFQKRLRKVEVLRTIFEGIYGPHFTR